MVTVYALRVPTVLEEYTYNKLMQKVSSEKREKMSRLQKQEDVYRTLLADVLVRSIICETFKVQNEDIFFHYNEFGKPFLKNIPDFSFSISHSGEWVVLATSNSLVGIDIEKICPIDIDIAKHFFTSEEYKDLASKPVETQLLYFYVLWTLKESYIKAVGKGLSIPLNSFVIKKNDEGNISLVEERNQSKRWFLKQYHIDETYKLSICALEKIHSKQLIIKHLAELLPE